MKISLRFLMFETKISYILHIEHSLGTFFWCGTNVITSKQTTVPMFMLMNKKFPLCDVF